MLGSSNALFVSRDHSCSVTHRLNCPIAHRAKAAQGGHNLKYSRLTVRCGVLARAEGSVSCGRLGWGEELLAGIFWV